jgi:hypothetical protein
MSGNRLPPPPPTPIPRPVVITVERDGVGPWRWKWTVNPSDELWWGTSGWAVSRKRAVAKAKRWVARRRKEIRRQEESREVMSG